MRTVRVAEEIAGDDGDAALLVGPQPERGAYARACYQQQHERRSRGDRRAIAPKRRLEYVPATVAAGFYGFIYEVVFDVSAEFAGALVAAVGLLG